MARRIFDPPRTFRGEFLGWLVALLGLVAFSFYMTDYALDFSTAGWSKYFG